MFDAGLNRFTLMSVWLLAVFLAGCAGVSTPVRHLSSDVCLVMPESTTRQEVLSFLGEPDRKIVTGEKSEVWIYQEASKSFLKKIPWLGENLGTQNFETVTVSFEGDLVKTCLYRQFDETEYLDFSSELQ